MLAWKGLSLKLVVSYLQKTKDSILKSLHVLLEHSARFCITIHILKIKSSSVWLRLLYRCIWLSTNSSTRTPQQNQKPPLNPRASNNFSGLNSTCSFFFLLHILQIKKRENYFLLSQIHQCQSLLDYIQCGDTTSLPKAPAPIKVGHIIASRLHIFKLHWSCWSDLQKTGVNVYCNNAL